MGTGSQGLIRSKLKIELKPKATNQFAKQWEEGWICHYELSTEIIPLNVLYFSMHKVYVGCGPSSMNGIDPSMAMWLEQGWYAHGNEAPHPTTGCI